MSEQSLLEQRERAFRRSRLKNFFWFLAFSIFAAWVFIYEPPTFQRWQDWLIVAAAVFFPLLAIVSLISWLRGWDPHQENKAVMWMLGAPFILALIVVAAVVIGIGLYLAFGWFGTIPSWAAVIIVLLIMIYLKR